MKLIISLSIVLLISSCATRCYTVAFTDIVYKDIFNNELTLRSRGMFAKEIDTNFVKTNITGLTLNSEQPNDALTFKYTIHQVEKIGKDTYLFLINSKKILIKEPSANTTEECSCYVVLTKKNKDKTELKKIVHSGNCYYPLDNREKKKLAEKVRE